MHKNSSCHQPNFKDQSGGFNDFQVFDLTVLNLAVKSLIGGQTPFGQDKVHVHVMEKWKGSCHKYS